MRLRCVWLLLLSLSCSKRSADELRPEASAAPQPSAGTAQKSVSPVSKERGSPPEDSEKLTWDFELFREATGRVFSLKHGALICAEPCRFPAAGKQKLWLVRDGHARPVEQLWPSSVWGVYASAMEKAELHTQVTFLGDYPAEVYAYGAVESRSGEGNLPLVKWDGAAWQRDHREIPSDRLTLPPREYDVALLSAPVDYNPLLSFAYGAGAPTMTAKPGLLALYDGKQWTTKAAPWYRRMDLTRLADGNTLALDLDAWLISPQGEITLLDVEGHHAETTVDIAGEAWILGDDRLSRPRERGRFKTAQLPTRKPSGSATGPTKRLPNPTDYTEQCKAPLVVLQHTDDTEVYGAELAGLFAEDSAEGAGLEAYYATFDLGARSVVQAKDKAAADRLLDVLKSHQNLKGELRCSDLKALLPDAHASSQYLKRLFIHARSGSLLELT